MLQTILKLFLVVIMTKPKALIFWEGLTPCTRLISEFCEICEVHLAYTAGPHDISSILEEIPAKSKILLRYHDDIDSIPCDFCDYSYIFLTGWKSRSWNRACVRAKALNPQLIVIVMVDNILTRHRIIRQIVGAFYYRYVLRHIYDIAFVPGVSSFRYMEFLGHPVHRIRTGYYGAVVDKALNDCVLREVSSDLVREPSFLFVGLDWKRKGLDILLKAYSLYIESRGQWRLDVVGCTREVLTNDLDVYCQFTNLITFHGYRDPIDVLGMMSIASCFVFPSRHDHWATVIAEAAARGCIIISSVQAGATFDIVHPGLNGFTFDAASSNAFRHLAELMLLVSNTKSSQRTSMSHASLKVSSLFSAERFAVSASSF